MKKQTPKIIATVMLTIIAVLVLYIGTSEGFDYGASYSGSENASGLEELTQDATQNADTSDTNTSNQDEDLNGELSSDSYINIPYIVNMTLPQTASDSELYNYQQTINISGDIAINAAVYYTDAIFLIFTHTSTEGDIVASKQTISIVKITYTGTITAIYNITSDGGSSFLAASLTSSGLVVVTNDVDSDNAATCGVYIFDVDLGEPALITMQSTISCNIFALSNSFLLFCQRSDLSVYMIEAGAITKSGTISSGNIVAIYEFGNYFTMIMNTIDGYMVTTMDNNLSTVAVRSILGKTALSIKPIVRDSEQYYLVAELYDNQLRIAEYTSTFKESDMRYIGVGICDTAYVLSNQSTIFALLENGDSSSLFIVNDSLQAQLGGSDILNDITTIYASTSYSDGYVILARQSETAISLIDIRDDGTYAVNQLSTNSNLALMVLDTDHNAIVFYLTESGICINSICL